MKGSEKQIAWAQQIRAEFLTEMNAMLDWAKSDPQALRDMEIGQDAVANAETIIRGIEAVDQAPWWIDNRDRLLAAAERIGFYYINDAHSVYQEYLGWKYREEYKAKIANR